MVAHEDIGVEDGVILYLCFLEVFFKLLIFRLVKKNPFPLVFPLPVT